MQKETLNIGSLYIQTHIEAFVFCLEPNTHSTKQICCFGISVFQKPINRDHENDDDEGMMVFFLYTDFGCGM